LSHSPSGKAERSLFLVCRAEKLCFSVSFLFIPRGYAAFTDGGIAAWYFIKAARKSIAFPLGELELETA
jgi:hypothetical protein